MSILADYITGKIGFPIKHTGISNKDWELKPYKRKEQNIIYKCSLCGSDINPDDYMSTFIDGLHLLPRERDKVFGGGVEHHYEVLGFICGRCDKEISDYDTYHAG